MILDELGLNRPVFNHNKCVICQKSFSTKYETIKQKVVNQTAIYAAFIQTNTLIKETSRCCSSHFDPHSNLLNEAALNQIAIYKDTTILTNEQTTELIKHLRVNN